MWVCVCVCVWWGLACFKIWLPNRHQIFVCFSGFCVSLDLPPILTSSGQTTESAAFKYEVVFEAALDVCVCVCECVCVCVCACVLCVCVCVSCELVLE